MARSIKSQYLKKIESDSKTLDFRKYLRVLPQMIEWMDAPGTKRFDLECQKGYNCLNELHRREDRIMMNFSRYALKNDLLRITADILKYYDKTYISSVKKRKDEAIEELISKEMICLGLRRIRNKTSEERKDMLGFLIYLKT